MNSTKIVPYIYIYIYIWERDHKPLAIVRLVDNRDEMIGGRIRSRQESVTYLKAEWDECLNWISHNSGVPCSEKHAQDSTVSVLGASLTI